MDAPQSMGIAIRPPLPARVWGALMALEASSKLAIVCVVFGWFFMRTLAVSLGSLEHGVRFFEMSAVIADPTRLFFGGDNPVHHALFALVCLACLSAPMAAHLTQSRTRWLGHLAPMALMLTCGALLYWRTSGEFLAAPDDAASLQGSLMHFANDLVHRGTDLVSRHVSIGAGSYLAMIGCVVLAVQGIRRFARPDALP
jgi:hypothetical protein